jgi:hypothetical protein
VRLAFPLLPLLGAVALTSTAHAQPAPHIESLSWNEGYPGSIICVRGTGLPDAVSACQTLFNDIPGMVIDTRPDELRVCVPPDLEPGEAKLVVIVAGARSNEVPFKVLDPRKARQFHGPRRARNHRIQLLRLLGPKQPDGHVAVSLVESKGVLRIEVKGLVELPDDFLIQIRVSRRDAPGYVCDAEATVRDGKFEATLQPTALPPGSYVVDAVFDVAVQPLDLQYRFDREVRNGTPGRLSDRATFVVPAPK